MAYLLVMLPGLKVLGHGDVETGGPAGREHDKLTQVVAVTEEPDSVLHQALPRLMMAAPSSNGDTPLHCAARAGNAKMVAHLIKLAAQGDRGRFVRMQNTSGETALHEAVRFGNSSKQSVEMVEALMRADKGLAGVDDEDGTSPMYLASTMGHSEIANKLHDCGDELSYSGPRGQNALHAAVLHNHKGITKSLLKWKPDLAKQRDVHGSTPLHFAAAAPDPALQFRLFVFSASNLERYSLGSLYFLPPRLLTRIFERSKLPVTQLLEADPTTAFQPDRHGSFPVHVAALADTMVALIALLTRYPACAALRNAKGQTFLHVAVEEKRLHAVAFVCHLWGYRPISKSVVNVQDGNGDTALHLAVRKGELDITKRLLGNRHVHISLQNMEGKTPMDLASGRVKPGFYFGLSAPRRILNMLTFADALSGSHRRDQIHDYDRNIDEKTESEKIKESAQIMGIGSVLVATATFTAALTMPGGVWTPGDSADKKLVVASPPPAGTPVLNGSYAFDGFLISNTLAFICSTLATFSLVYCGVAAVEIQKRIELVYFSVALLMCSARSFWAAMAFALYLLLANVAQGTAIASCVMTSLALLDGIWFLLASSGDTGVFISRKLTATLLKLGTGFLINLLYLFWPYLVIGGYLLYDFLINAGKFHSIDHHP
ncbi:hypothetical protein EJB05_36259, partial [Eragrostis curvula]